MFDVARELNKAKDEDVTRAARLGGCLKALGGVLGLLRDDPENYLRSDASSGLSNAEVDELITRRAEARANKDWSEADRIRELLQAHDIVMEDGSGGTRWRRG